MGDQNTSGSFDATVDSASLSVSRKFRR